LVSAPAGSGKTQLVVSWLEQASLPGPVAWVSVERGARDGMGFWGDVVRVLQLSGAAAGAEALLTLTPAPRVAAVDFDRRLRDGLAALATPAVLVIDDLHELDDREALERLGALIAYRLPNLRVVLITRRDPAIGLHRLRVSGDLTEIRAADLQFGVEEVGALVARSGITLGDQSIARLHERTEGWAAALRLALIALAGRADGEAFLEELSGSERTIADYLLSEVLGSEPPAVQQLLARTAILERVNGALVDRLAGGRAGQRVLRKLEEANALVQSLDVGRSWFRYHPMLRDFLRDELESDPAEDVEELHRAATQWYAENGFGVEAIRHAQAGRDWPRAVDLLMEQVFTLVLDGETATFQEFVEPLAERAVDDPESALLVAVDRLIRGAIDPAAAYLASAERLAASVPAARRRRFDAVVAASELYVARMRGDFEAALRRARPILSPAEGETWADVVPNEDLRALALMDLGFVELWARRLEDAEEHLQAGLALARAIGRPYLALGCLGPLAEVAVMMAAPNRAKKLATEAIAIAEQLGSADTPVAAVAYSALGIVLAVEGRLDDAAASLERAGRAFEGVHDVEAGVVRHYRLALVRYGQGRYADAFRSAREAERAHQRISSPHYLAEFIRTVELRAAMRLGDTEAVRRALDDLDAEKRDVTTWRTLAADLHLTEGTPEGAVEELAPLLDGSIALNHVNEEAQVLLLEAVARDAMGQSEQAEAAVERALGLAERQAWFSITIATPMALPLLRRHPRDRTAHDAFLAEVLDRLGEVSEQPDPSSPVLSDRELQVLRFLPTNLQASEIGSELLLSVHTVKSHMRKIYAKLGAHRRAEAVERARSLGLLPPGHTKRASN
jgi:LuxR family maltose regulon positive regulatory protein